MAEGPALGGLFRAIVDSATDGVAVFEPRLAADGAVEDFVYRYVNPRGVEILGFPESEVLGRGMLEVSPVVGTSGLFGRYVTAYAGEPLADTVEYRSDRASGWFAVRAGAVAGHLVLRYRDVTAAVELEQAEQESRTRIEEILASISDAFLTFDHEWRFAYVNDEACRVLGRSRDDLVGQSAFDMFPDADNFERMYRLAADTGQPVTFDEYYPEPLDTWYSVRAYPGQGGVSVFFRDVGQQRRLQARLAQAQRLDSIATLAGGIAHDFNNLLTVVGGHVSLLDEDLGDDHPNRVDVDAIVASVQRATELTRQMLTFSRRQVIRPRVLDLNDLIDAAAPLIRRLLRPGHELHVLEGSDPVMVEIDASEFDHAVMALVDNAIDAMGPTGRLTIETAMVELGPDYVEQVSELAPGWYGVVSVSDDGDGMPAEVLSRALEPFFTTRPAGQGTGLGLSAVHGMARQVGGHVTIYSEEGVGTTVRVYLPRAGIDVPDPPDDDAAAASTSDLRGDETILVADDNASVRQLIERVLSEHGYRVVVASGPDEALEVIDAGAESIDLLLTDVVMPGRTGHELAEAVVERLGPIPTLYVSGYTENSVIRHGVPVGDVEFLAKPFAPSDLVATVRRVLDGASLGDAVG
ncbi:MAG: PAS domain-containing protein [Acidimicrobiales bacterium]